MHLAYLSGSQLPSPFANSVHVVKMCRAFTEHGWTVTLHGRAGTTGSGDPLAPYGVEPTFALALESPPAGRVVQSAGLALATRRRIAKAQPDLLYARHLWSLLATESLGIPFVYEAHAMPANAAHRAAEAWLFRRPGFRRLVVISGALRADYLAAFPWLEASQVLVAHDGADRTPDAVGHRIAAPLPGARRATLQVGYIGHLYPGKGMEMVAALAPRTPHMDFHVVGGTDADLARWKAQASYPNLVYHGFVPHSTLPVCYAALDVVLVPVSTRVALQGGKGDIGRWTSSLKLFEAMAHGKPLLVSDHPNIREVIEPGVNVLMATAGDVDAWADCLAQLELDPALRARLGDAARKTLEGEYTWHQRAACVTRGLAA
jgi:glycosyltransferase involved in cell wall biosynthesis